MLQGYGMTEASPVISVNRDDDNVPESVGPPLPGVEVRLAENNELLARGANIMLGYWRNPEASRAALSWTVAGCGPAILPRSRMARSTSAAAPRTSWCFRTANKLPPQDVEFAILRDPIFEQVMLVGEGRPYPVLLAVSKETDEAKLLEPRERPIEALSRLGACAPRDPFVRAMEAWTTGC
jgi:long-chain acyl-CoA synthetase